MKRRLSGSLVLGLVIVLGMLGARDGHSEVTLVQSGRQVAVRVQPTRLGPWQALGASSATALNPEGDLLGDAWPAWTADANRALVAWHRPLTASLLVARGGQGRWELVDERRTEGLLGTPLPLISDSVPLVAWRERTTIDERVLVAVLGVEGETRLEGELLLGGAASGGTVAVATGRLLEGDRLVELVLAIGTPPLVPIDFDRASLGSVALERLERTPLRIWAGPELGLETGRLVACWPDDRSEGLLVAEIDAEGRVNEVGEIPVPPGRGEGALRAAARRAIRLR